MFWLNLILHKKIFYIFAKNLKYKIWNVFDISETVCWQKKDNSKFNIRLGEHSAAQGAHVHYIRTLHADVPLMF